MLLSLPREIIYHIFQKGPDLKTLFQLRQITRDFYQDPLILKNINQNANYIEFLHDYYFIILMSFQYYPTDIKNQVVREIQLYPELHNMKQKILIYLKEILRNHFFKRDEKFKEYLKLEEFELERVPKIEYAFDKNYPIQIGKEFGTLKCNCGSKLCRKKKYSIKDINSIQLQNLPLGCQKGFDFLRKNSNISDINYRYRLVENLLYN